MKREARVRPGPKDKKANTKRKAPDWAEEPDSPNQIKGPAATLFFWRNSLQLRSATPFLSDIFNPGYYPNLGNSVPKTGASLGKFDEAELHLFILLL